MKPMKHKLTHNLGLKLISVLIASVLWLVVSNNNDPEIAKAIKNVPITFKNQEVINQVNKSYTVVDGIEKVTVYVNGRKSVVSRMNSSSFTIKADLQNYNEALGTVPLDVVCSDKRISQENIRISPSTIKVTMEDKVEESFGVVATVSGKLEKGYEIGKTNMSYGDTVKIAGPASLIKIIGKVTVVVDVTDLHEDTEAAFPVRIEDKNGAQFTESQMSKLEIKDEEGIILSENKAMVSIQIWKLYQDIPVKVNITGTPAENYRVSKVTLTPKTVNLVGDETSIENLGGELELDDIISVEGMTDNQEFTLDVNNTLQNYENIRLETDTTSSIKVSIAIAVSGSRSFQVPLSNISMKNVPKDKRLIFSPADFVTINVKTEEMDLDELRLEDIKGSVDLKNCSINDSYTVPIEITLPEGYEVVGDTSLVVNIEDIEDEAEREAPEEEE